MPALSALRSIGVSLRSRNFLNQIGRLRVVSPITLGRRSFCLSNLANDNVKDIDNDDMREGSGRVKFFNSGRGYGFIAVDGTDDVDVFVHQTKIKMEGFRTLHEEQPVKLTYYKDTKGYKAESVTPDVEWAKPEDDRRRGRGYNDRGHGGGGGYSSSDRYDDRNDRSGGGYDGGYGGGGGVSGA